MSRGILIVQDNHDIAKLPSLHLKDLHCEVELAGDGPSGLELAQSGGYDLIILDLMLPGLEGVEGLEVCRRLRGQVDYTPILMLTGKSNDAGSEANTEDRDDIPAPPCDDGINSNPIADAEGFVHVHASIHGVGGLVPATHDWRNPVCEITVERIEEDKNGDILI